MQGFERYSLRYKSSVLLLALLLAAFHVAGESMPAGSRSKGANAWVIQWQPVKLVNGSPVIFQVVPPARLTRLSAKWLEHDVFFTYDAASKSWYGIAGISLETRSGIYPLELKGTTSPGTEISFVRKFAVRPAKYPNVAVTVAKRYTEPSPEQLEHIHQDKTVKQDVFRQTDPKREWLGKFRPAPSMGKFRACIRGSIMPFRRARRFRPLTQARFCWQVRCILKEIAWCSITGKDC